MAIAPFMMAAKLAAPIAKATGIGGALGGGLPGGLLSLLKGGGGTATAPGQVVPPPTPMAKPPMMPPTPPTPMMKPQVGPSPGENALIASAQKAAAPSLWEKLDKNKMRETGLSMLQSAMSQGQNSPSPLQLSPFQPGGGGMGQGGGGTPPALLQLLQQYGLNKIQ